MIGGILAILGYTLLTIAITSFPMTNQLEPINVYNALLSAERAGEIDFTQHGYPWVYGLLTVSIFLLAILAARLAKPLERICWFTPQTA